METTIETAKKTLATAIGAGTAALDKARELPARLSELPAKIGGLPTLISELPAKISELPQQIQALQGRVGEYVTLPEAFKVGSLDLRDLPATLQAYAAKGTERALTLVGEGRETAKKATEFLKSVSFVPIHSGSNGNGNGNGKAKKPAARKPAAKKTAKKATVPTATTTTVE